jgi:hypothetical protein
VVRGRRARGEGRREGSLRGDEAGRNGRCGRGGWGAPCRGTRRWRRPPPAPLSAPTA